MPLSISDGMINQMRKFTLSFDVPLSDRIWIPNDTIFGSSIRQSYYDYIVKRQHSINSIKPTFWFDLDKMSKSSIDLCCVKLSHCYHHYPFSKAKQRSKLTMRFKHSIRSFGRAHSIVCGKRMQTNDKYTKTVQKYATCSTRSMKILTPIHI